MFTSLSNLSRFSLVNSSYIPIIGPTILPQFSTILAWEGCIDVGIAGITIFAGKELLYDEFEEMNRSTRIISWGFIGVAAFLGLSLANRGVQRLHHSIFNDDISPDDDMYKIMKKLPDSLH